MAISTAIKQQIIQLYQQNNSIVAISKLVHVSEPTISKILKNAGIPIRKINYQKLQLDSAVVNAMYDNGQSTYQIAAHFGCSDETIRHLINAIRDITTRNRLSADSIAKIGAASSKNWQDPDYIEKVHTATHTEEYKDKLRQAGKSNYLDSLGKWIANAESKLIISRNIKTKWLDPKYRAKQQIWFNQRGATLTAAARLALTDPAKRKQWLNRLRAGSAKRRLSQGNVGWISSAQKQLYYILSNSGIDYYEEGLDTQISAFYVVDCVIPQQQNMTKPLIIEVQGEYWHSLPKTMLKDRQKATYIRKHTNYNLLYLSDLHLNSFSEIEAKLGTHGLTLAKTICSASDVIPKQISESEASLFYSIFHYSGTVRKGSITFGAFIDADMVAAVSYCYPIRQEIANRLGYEISEVLEISRLARRTNVVCKNLISRLIGKTRKMLPANIKCLVSFSDATYGHTGIVYKACGFQEDGVVAPDYCYVSIFGRYHKKTIWDRAKKHKMTETDYAEKHGLIRIDTGPKTRWVYRLK